jgi:hypothetical protein
MEASRNPLYRVEVERTELASDEWKDRGLAFRRRLSEIVCKPPYAAWKGNLLCGER